MSSVKQIISSCNHFTKAKQKSQFHSNKKQSHLRNQSQELERAVDDCILNNNFAVEEVLDWRDHERKIVKDSFLSEEHLKKINH